MERVRNRLLDDELIATPAAALPVPLVLHGSSGVSDDGLRSAVRHGMTPRFFEPCRPPVRLTEHVPADSSDRAPVYHR
ncbi:class II fructose-bisphosphate aldolase [Nocardia sp. NPDC055053]